MKALKRILSITLSLLLILALSVPAAAAFPSGERPAWLSPNRIRLQHLPVNLAVLGLVETSLLLLYNGELVHEQYRRGFDAATIHPMNSAAKSFAATMVGVAIQDGYIDCISQKAVEFFPDATIVPGQESKLEMTIEHLLNMRAGLPWLVQQNSLDFMLCEEDSGLAAFETRQLHPPGARWIYDGGAAAQILVAIVERASGRCFYEYIRESLFEPLGMDSAHWQLFTNDGRVVGGMGLYMNVYDMLRYGQLYLYDGVWEGERILPEGWTEQTFFGEGRIIFGQLPYNLLWWENFQCLYRRAGPSARAQGFAGQIISVYPETGLVMVRTGTGPAGNGASGWPLIRNNGNFLYIFP